MNKDFVIYSHKDIIKTELPCPNCQKFPLYIDKKSSIYKVNKEYIYDLKYARETPYIYDYISDINGFLQCDNCKKEVAFIGEITGGMIDYNDDEYEEFSTEEEILYFKYFSPAIYRIDILKEYPTNVKEILIESFALFYNHKSSCVFELKKIFNIIINNLCRIVQIPYEDNLNKNIEKLIKKSKYSVIKENLQVLKIIFEVKDINPDAIYEHLERILVFIYREEYKSNNIPLIITEGKTDWKHLKKALERFQEQGVYVDLNIKFKEFEDISMSDSELDAYAQSHAKKINERQVICIFDRDLSKRVEDYGKNDFIHVGNKHYVNFVKDKCKQVYGVTSAEYLEIEKKLELSKFKEIDTKIRGILKGKEHKEWKTLLHNNVYALCIPKLNDELDEICIEFYYKENDLKKENSEGKRLFIANEFEFKENINDCNRFFSKCGKFKTDTQSGTNQTRQVTLQYPNKKDRGYVYKVEENECIKSNNMNLSKNDFAKNIYYDVEGFDNFDIENFKLIFDVIEKIIND